MPDLKDLPSIAPYLNPDYWEGHSLGYGEIDKLTPVQAQRSDLWHAKRVMETELRADAITPIHTLRIGDSFEPSNYQPGTIVLFGLEALRGAPVIQDYKIDELRSQPLPIRPTQSSPSIGHYAPFNLQQDQARRYFSTLIWGVVPGAKDSGYLACVGATSLTQRQRGVKVHERILRPYITPITIGETRHHPPTPSRQEQLSRVNILHLIAFGSVEHKKRRVFSFAGRTVFSH